MSGPAIAIECRDIGLTFPGASGEATVALSGVSCRFLPGKVTAMDIRAATALAGEIENVAEFCRRHQISRVTFYKWRARFAAEGH